MAKMRGIKPELWTDEKFVLLSMPARLMFIGMWNHACDNGHLDDSPIQLKMRIFPADNVDAAPLIAELLGTDLVLQKNGYLKVKNLSEHQKIDKRFLLLCDHCAHDVDAAFTDADRPPKPGTKTTKPASAPRAHPVSTVRDQSGPHDEGEGEGEGEGEKDSTSNAEALTDTEPLFEQFWETYGKKVEKKLTAARWATAMKKKGVTADLLLESATTYTNHQRSIGKHPQYTKNPSVWLNQECWNDELPTTDGPPTTPSIFSIVDENGRWKEPPPPSARALTPRRVELEGLI